MQRLTIPFVLAMLLFSASCSAEEAATPQRVRPSALAGSWYPAGADRLRATVSKYLDDAEAAAMEGRLCALIAPHAGYAYSGPTAGWAFKQAAGKNFDRVIVMAPSHRAAFSGFSIMDVDAYATPLGVLPLDA